MDDFRTQLLEVMPVVKRYAIRLAGADAEDLLQATLLRALQYEHKYVPGNLKSWVCTIECNLFKERCRYNKMHHRETGVDPWDLDVVTVPPEPIMEFQEYDAAVNSLSPTFQEAILLGNVLGYSNRELAEFWGIQEVTAKTRLHRARKALAELLR